jgi:hypothetical protein
MGKFGRPWADKNPSKWAFFELSFFHQGGRSPPETAVAIGRPRLGRSQGGENASIAAAGVPKRKCRSRASSPLKVERMLPTGDYLHLLARLFDPSSGLHIH